MTSLGTSAKAQTTEADDASLKHCQCQALLVGVELNISNW